MTHAPINKEVAAEEIAATLTGLGIDPDADRITRIHAALATHPLPDGDRQTVLRDAVVAANRALEGMSNAASGAADVPAHDDFVTHRSAWRKALLIAREHGPGVGIVEDGYWTAMIEVFDRNAQEYDSSSEPRRVPDDAIAHRFEWREALVVAREHAEVSWPDVDDRSYWDHELRVYDRVFSDAGYPSMPPEPQHVDNIDGKRTVFSDPTQALGYGLQFGSAQFSEETLHAMPTLAAFKGERLKVVAEAMRFNALHQRDELLFKVSSLRDADGPGDGYFFASALTALSSREAVPELLVPAVDGVPVTGALLSLVTALHAARTQFTAEAMMAGELGLLAPGDVMSRCHKLFFGDYAAYAERCGLARNERTFDALMASTMPAGVDETANEDLPAQFVFRVAADGDRGGLNAIHPRKPEPLRDTNAPAI